MTPVALHVLPTHRTHAAPIAEGLDVPIFDLQVHRFPDAEVRLTLGGASTTALLYLPLDQPNDKLVILLLACDALRRSGTRRIVLVAPYLCYMRQDIAFHPLEAVSQSAVGRLLSGLVDRVVTVDAHLHRTRQLSAVFPGIEADNLSAMPAVAAALAQTPLDPATALPVQIYMWSNEAERAFVERMSGAIMILLAFLMVMNITAIILRRKFERRW